MAAALLGLDHARNRDRARIHSAEEESEKVVFAAVEFMKWQLCCGRIKTDEIKQTRSNMTASLKMKLIFINCLCDK